MLKSYICQAAVESKNRLRWREHMHCSMFRRNRKETVCWQFDVHLKEIFNLLCDHLHSINRKKSTEQYRR